MEAGVRRSRIGTSAPAWARHLLGAVAIAVGILGPASATARAQRTGTTSRLAIQGVERTVREEMQRRHIPALQIAVVQHGTLVFLGAYGVANIQDSVRATRRTLFSINSITKAFVGVAVMQLVEAGKVDLGAPVSRYLDGLPAAWRSVTIRQL